MRSILGNLDIMQIKPVPDLTEQEMNTEFIVRKFRLFRHAFKNALVPVITIFGLQFALLLGGAILTETTFSWPGIGSKLVAFINARDYIGVQVLVTVIAILIVSVSVVIDIINGLIDPRVRY